MIVDRGLALVSAGLAPGFAASLLVSRVLSGLLYDAGARGPGAYFAVGVILAVTALHGSWEPGRRAAGMDRTLALRSG